MLKKNNDALKEEWSQVSRKRKATAHPTFLSEPVLAGGVGGELNRPAPNPACSLLFPRKRCL
jgi:hypothetical protein